MTPHITVSHFHAPGPKITIKREGSKLRLTDWTKETRDISQGDANALVMAILDGSGVTE